MLSSTGNQQALFSVHGFRCFGDQNLIPTRKRLQRVNRSQSRRRIGLRGEMPLRIRRPVGLETLRADTAHDISGHAIWDTTDTVYFAAQL